MPPRDNYGRDGTMACGQGRTAAPSTPEEDGVTRRDGGAWQDGGTVRMRPRAPMEDRVAAGWQSMAGQRAARMVVCSGKVWKGDDGLILSDMLVWASMAQW